MKTIKKILLWLEILLTVTMILLVVYFVSKSDFSYSERFMLVYSFTFIAVSYVLLISFLWWKYFKTRNIGYRIFIRAMLIAFWLFVIYIRTSAAK